ncbi:MAG: VCBS repeat-containing protein, partial [Candidatus Moraniibacteriota bacterium]
TGRAYIFYNDGSIPTTAATADVIITGEASSYFSRGLTSGDFNADGRTDLVIGAYGYSGSTGRAYIFYNDGSIPTTAATADVIITGEATSQFGVNLTAGDWNADGRTDLVVGANIYSTNTGRAYIFYNDGSIPTTAGTADVTITGEATNNYFGISLTAGDLNADGRTDLVIGAYGYSTNTGRTYIFYNDGSIPTTAATADMTITGSATSQDFGSRIYIADFKSDGIMDLLVGSQQYSTYTGRLYIFTSETASEAELPGTFYLKGTGKMKGTGKLK